MSLKLLRDENLPYALDALLSLRGHEVKRPPRGSSDFEVAAIAKRERLVLISFDSDFANILNYPPANFSV